MLLRHEGGRTFTTFIVVCTAVRTFFGRNDQSNQQKCTTDELLAELYEFMEQDKKLHWYKHLVELLVNQHLRAQTNNQVSLFEAEMPNLLGIMRDEGVDYESLEQLKQLLNNICMGEVV